MLNRNFGMRMELVDAAQHGIVEITMRRTNGTTFTFPATLLPKVRDCATFNSEQYYKKLGTTYKKEKAKAKLQRQRDGLIEKKLSWQEQVDRDINLFYVVDTDTFSWRQVSLRAIAKVEYKQFIE